jgi:cobalt-zinc-cadmium resistance protein CzcA
LLVGDSSRSCDQSGRAEHWPARRQIHGWSTGCEVNAPFVAERRKQLVGRIPIVRAASKHQKLGVGRDQGGFVADAQDRFAKQIKPPDGYSVEWLGMFENLRRASKYFMVIIPATAAIIFVVPAVTFGSLRAAFVLLLPIPFALMGGAIALAVRDMHLNVSAGVGFATLFGVAIMDGVLMFKGITTYRLQDETVDDAIVHGRIDRLRPILMTSLVAIVGLLPASLATGLGSDVQRPLATVIIRGLAGSALFTQFITPVFYRIFVPPLPESKSAEALEARQQLRFDNPGRARAA